MSSAAATTRAEEQIASLYDPANNGTIRYDALNRPISVISSAANTASAVGYRQSALTWDTLGRLSTQSIRARNNRARRGLAVMSSSRSQSVTQWGGGETGKASHTDLPTGSVRMDYRRFTRLNNGYSKKLAHHEAAAAPFVATYNLTRVHSGLKTTPAVAMGVTDHVWSIPEPVDVALAVSDDEPLPPTVSPDPAPIPPPTRDRPQLRVIQGGLA